MKIKNLPIMLWTMLFVGAFLLSWVMLPQLAVEAGITPTATPQDTDTPEPPPPPPTNTPEPDDDDDDDDNDGSSSGPQPAATPTPVPEQPAEVDGAPPILPTTGDKESNSNWLGIGLSAVLLLGLIASGIKRLKLKSR